MPVFLIKRFLEALRYVPLPVARSLGRALGRIVWLLGLREKHVAQVNIRLAYPDLSTRDQRQLAYRSVLSAGEWFAELGIVWMGTEAQIRNLAVAVEGADAVNAARVEGRGVVFLAPHVGNWEYAGLFVNMFCPMACLYEPPENPGIEEFIVKVRGRFGMVTYPTTPKGVVGLTRTLKAGQTIGILPDQVPRDLSAGCNAPFMGEPCFTPTLAVKLAQKTGSKLFYLVAIRVPGGYRVRFVEAESPLYDPDMTVAMTAMNQGIEQLILTCPEQYQWTYKRFRTRPVNGPNHYHKG